MRQKELSRRDKGLCSGRQTQTAEQEIVTNHFMITEIAFTGTPVKDIAKARAFYEGVLGLKVTKESAGGMWVEYDIGPATFAIGCYGEVWKPMSDGTLVAFEVDNLDNEMARLKASSVQVHMDITESPVCRFAIIFDPDKNAVMLHQRKPASA